MTRYMKIAFVLALIPVAAGCATAARDTTSFAMVDETTVNAPFEDTWQHTKTVFRERDIILNTRDKRGFFVAFTSESRNLLFVPHRMKYTVQLEEVSASATRVRMESVKQVYGVSLLTYPDWHDRQTTDNAEALEILESIAAKAGA